MRQCVGAVSRRINSVEAQFADLRSRGIARDSNQAYIEGAQPPGQGFCNRSQTIESHRAARQHGSQRRTQHAPFQVCPGRGNMPQRSQNQQDRVFRDRVGIAARSRHIGDPDTSRTGCFQIDAIQSRAPLLNQAKAPSIHHRRIDPRHQGNHHLDAVQRVSNRRTGRHHDLIGPARFQTLPQHPGSGGKGFTTKRILISLTAQDARGFGNAHSTGTSFPSL